MAFGRDYPPGRNAPVTGGYCLIDVFGKETAIRITVAHGERLPRAPRGHGWRLVREVTEPSGTKRMLLHLIHWFRFHGWEAY